MRNRSNIATVLLNCRRIAIIALVRYTHHESAAMALPNMSMATSMAPMRECGKHASARDYANPQGQLHRRST